MPTSDELNALAERVERVERAMGWDRELDELIADQLFERIGFSQLKDAPIGTGCMMWWQDGHQQSALRYTSSLDAAMKLVPEGCHVELERWADGRGRCEVSWTGQMKSFVGSNPRARANRRRTPRQSQGHQP